MAVRQDRAQLIVEIKAAESSEYQKLIKSQKDLVRDTKKLKVGTDEYNQKLADTIELNKKFSKIDINKLSIKQIQERSRQLERLKKILPQNSKALKDMEVEQKKLNTALANARSRTRGVAQGMDKMQGAGAKFISFLKTTLPLIGAFFAIGKLVEWGKQLLTIGTEIDTLDRKFKTVFGEAGDIVSAFAERNAESMGLTRSRYREAAAAVGDLLIPMGFQRDEAAQLSAGLVNLSGALAEWSLGKISSKQASDILSKAMLGERDGLKQLGISLTEADIKARLAAKGQDKLTGSNLEQAKALATYDLVLEKSKDAQEAFAKNTGTLIRKKNELKAKIQENVEVLARRLIPIWNQVTVWGLKIVEGFVQFALILKEIPKFIKENQTTLIALGVALIAFNLQSIKANALLLLQKIRITATTKAKQAAIIVTKGFRAAMKGLNATIRANPIGFIIGLLISLALAFSQAYKRSEKFRNFIDGLSKIFKYTLGPTIQNVREWFGRMFEKAKDFPIIGGYIRGITKAIKLARDAFENVGATFAGLKAAAKQAFENIKLQFVEMGISAVLAAKKLDLAFSIRSSTKERLRKEIAALENLKTVAAKAGKSIGEAYSSARDEFILKNPPTDAKAKKGGGGGGGDGGNNDPPKPPTAPSGESAEKQRKKDLKLALAAQKDLFARLAFLDEVKHQDDLDRATGNAEALAALKHDHRQREIENDILHFQDQIAILDEFGEGESTKVLEIQAKIAKLKNDQAASERERLAEINQGKLDDLDKIYEGEVDKLQSKFDQALISEGEFKELQLQQEIEAIAQRQALLTDLKLQDTEAFAELERQRTDVEREQSELRVAAADRESEIKQNIQKAGLAAATNALRFGLKLLKKESKARKAFIVATKAFEIAKVIINLQSQIAAINAKYAAIPGAGLAFAAFETAIAKVNAGVAIGTILAQKFYKGGQVSPHKRVVSGQRVNLAPNAPTQRGGDNVLAFLKRGEVVLNDDQQQHFGGPQAFKRAGVPGFAAGGLVDVNTTPTRNPDLQLGQSGATGVDLAPINDTLNTLAQAIIVLTNTRLKADVALTDIEDASEELNEIRDAASL